MENIPRENYKSNNLARLWPFIFFGFDIFNDLAVSNVQPDFVKLCAYENRWKFTRTLDLHAD